MARKTDTQKARDIAARMTTPAPIVPSGPKAIKASEILAEIRDEYRAADVKFRDRLARMVAGLSETAYDISRPIAGYSRDVCEAQFKASILKGAVARLEGGAVRTAGETFAGRLADVREQADWELKSVLRNRPWESHSTCPITNALGIAELSGKVSAHEFLASRAARYLNPEKFAIEDDVTETVGEAVEVVSE